MTGCELETPLAERERLLVALKRVVSPTLAELQGDLKSCAQVRLAVDFDDGGSQERTRTLLFPTADEALVMRILYQLLDEMHWCAPAVALTVTLEQIQDVVVEQLSLFAALRQPQGEVESERERKLREVQRYLVARFGASRLQRIVVAQPGAPLPEWRVSWLEGGE